MQAPSDASESSATPCAQDDRRGLGGFYRGAVSFFCVSLRIRLYLLRIRDFPYNSMTRGWDWNPQSYSREVSGVLGFGTFKLRKVSRTNMAMENPPLEGVFHIQRRSSIAILVFTQVHVQKKQTTSFTAKAAFKKTSVILVDYNESKGIYSVTFQQDIQCSENINIFDNF